MRRQPRVDYPVRAFLYMPSLFRSRGRRWPDTAASDLLGLAATLALCRFFD